MSAVSNEHSGILVSVTPSQSAFFAGETFTVSITFTNTRRASTIRPQPRSASAVQTHRRGVQSVSSVPLARPPTSPGSPQTANVFASGFPLAEEVTHRKRKGLVGQLELQNPRLSAVAAEETFSAKRKRSSPKSLSVSITPNELVERLVGKSEGSAPGSPEFQSEGIESTRKAGFSPGQSTPARARDVKLPFHPSHPHARKQSVMDFQAQEISTPFALSLDPIAEHSGAPPATPLAPSPLAMSAPTLDSSQRQPLDQYVPRQTRSEGRAAHSRKSSLANAAVDIGLGRPTTLTSSAPRQPRSAFSSTFSPPGTEVLLWAYAQLVGTLELDGAVVPFPLLDRLQDRLLSSGAIGRGSMDIGTSPSPSTGFLSSFLPQRSPRSPLMRHQRSPSLLSSLPSFGLSSLFKPPRSSPFVSPGRSRDEEGTLPTLDLQPSVLAVDLPLTPGESRTYTYTLSLPKVLPPTFRGKAVRFSYELVVGTSHASTNENGVAHTPVTPEQHRKKIMKIPIRIYNNVSIDEPPPCYELAWPAQKLGSIRQGMVQEGVPASKKVVDARHPLERRPPAVLYARQLIADLHRGKDPIGVDDEDEIWSCREAVEILTRNSRKISYDIGKDGEQVSVLTLVKASYRVGETISGIVELNQTGSIARVLKLSAFLEAHEHLPSSWADPNTRHLPKVHAEYHSTVTPNSTRLPFSLDVPSDVSPAFSFAAADIGDGQGGLRWRLRMCFLVTSGKGQSRHLIRDGYEDDWGVAWRASSALTPLTANLTHSPSSVPSTPVPGGWSTPVSNPSSGSAAEVDDHDWRPVKAETVECEIPLTVWPANTLFRPVETVFAA